jgi:uncharacterized protein YukE
MPDILYDPAAMNNLYSALNTEGRKIEGYIGDLESAKTGFLAAMGGEKTQGGFLDAYKLVQVELQDSLEKLDRLAVAVEVALQRALSTDGQIGNMFGSFG